MYRVTVQDTKMLKGISILMMLWLHLFSDLEMIEQCRWLIPYFNGKPFVYTISRIASSCVPIYIFLGGYGLACVWLQTPQHKMQVIRRVLALMVNFWIVCLLFIPLGCIINPSRYPKSLVVLLLNITGISESYNGAWWFLLPYVIMTICSPYFIRRLMTNKCSNDIRSLLILLTIHILVYIITEHLKIPYDSFLHIVFPILNFLFMLFFFSVGVLFVKYDIFEYLRSRLISLGNLCWFLLLILLSLKMFLGNASLINLPFVLLLLPLLLSIRIPSRIYRLFLFFGKHSTNMWLTHYFFSYYIFGSLIYNLQYPLLIYCVLILLSLVSSYVIQVIFAPIRRIIRE